ncbi:zonular occludens toxin domain-containing protein [Acetobacterium sp. KB-1]|jgi:hypothetical protein|uniref:zonular occludens toxin domain-containing protein n=1 Tax=Acetobacterium sp. KB-1 TaxID=2184575 RepID=UPI000DBECCD1|nr:zonular occludens toxin domain-containing protein [Acetobacterium sp. KB-1]AWW26998.1 hypothetical protein DOZ58_10345 [Acetobacterium sp. KB-1]
MIRCYTGVPGSGKSLHSIRKILDFLSEGKNVIANFPLKINELNEEKYTGRYFYVPNEKITVDYLYQFYTMYHEEDEENQTLLMIDEASVKFNCCGFMDRDRLKFCSFFAQHRKFGYAIVMVCQNLRQIDRQIRDLVEIEVIHRKLNNYSYFRMLPFPLFVAVEKNLALKEKNEHEFFLYSRKIGRLYDTFYDFTRIDKFQGNEELEKLVSESEIIRDEPEDIFKEKDTFFKSLKKVSTGRITRQTEGVPQAGPLPQTDDPADAESDTLLDISIT